MTKFLGNLIPATDAPMLPSSIQRILTLCIISLLFCLPANLHALHLAGGDMTYQFLERNGNLMRYKITLRIFRDCNGGGPALDSSPEGMVGEVTLFSGPYSGPAEIGKVTLPAPRITRLPITSGNPCLLLPPNLCVEEGLYEFEISFPYTGNTIWVIYSKCCRNSTIVNVFAPSTLGATYYAEITKESQDRGNSSPVFNLPPPPVFCANAPFNYSMAAKDADGDDLLYKWTAAIHNQGNFFERDRDFPPPFDSVPYLKLTFTSVMPLGPGAGLTLDEQTGTITGLPKFQGQFIAGFYVEEYRNGVLLNRTFRDIQFNVVNCPSAVNALLNGIPSPAGDYEFKACGTNMVNFINSSADASLIKGYEWYFKMPGGPLQATTKNYQLVLPGPGTYQGFLVVNPGFPDCTDTAKITILARPNIPVDFEVLTDLCEPQPIQFRDLTPQRNFRFRTWTFEPGKTATGDAPVYTYANPGRYKVTLAYTDSVDCVFLQEKQIDWYPLVALNALSAAPQVGCVPLQARLSITQPVLPGNYQVSWSSGNTDLGRGRSIAYTFDTPGSYDVRVGVESPSGCRFDSTFLKHVRVYPIPEANLELVPASAPLTILNPAVQFLDRSTGATEWLWQFGSSGSSTSPNPRVVFRDTGVQKVVLIVSNDGGCTDSTSVKIDVAPVFFFEFPNAFTPNFDGLNDVFLPKTLYSGFSSYTLQVYNRWGGLVFESNDPDIGWPGTFRPGGDAAPPGLYHYVAQVKGPRGEDLEKTGQVLLIR